MLSVDNSWARQVRKENDMQVSPESQTFGEIHELTPEVEKVMKEMTAEGKIIAKADSREPLQKLQDDLRKRGYKNIFDKR
jgi:glutamine synthetase